MSLQSDLKNAERVGITISKERLIALIRDSNARQFAIIQDKTGCYVIVDLSKGDSTKR